MSKAIPSYALAPASVQDPMRFLFDGLEVRAVDRDGRPWFVGKDVCQVLGHVNTKDALSRLPDSERSTVKVPDALGRDRDTTIISIAGVFRLAMTSRVDGAERFRSWLTDEVLPQIYTRGSYGPQTVTLDPESRALIANLEARVTALEARPVALPTTPHPQLGELILRHFAPTGNHPHGARWMTNPEIRTALRPGSWSRSEVIALTKALDRLGFGSMRRHGNIRVWATYPAPALPSPARPALPAPRKDGVHPLRAGRVRIKDGVPFEVYSGLLVADDHLANIEAAFGAAFPGWHLGRDWRSAGGWPSEAAPADAGLVARARRVGVVDQPARVIDDEDGEPVAVEWKGQRSPRELESMSAELRRLRYSAGPWKRVPGGYRAELHSGLIGVAALGTPAHQRLVLRDTVPHDHQGGWSNFAA